MSSDNNLLARGDIAAVNCRRVIGKRLKVKPLINSGEAEGEPFTGMDGLRARWLA